MKNGGGSVMIWGAISWKFAGPIIFFMEELTKETIYKQVLSDQVHPMAQVLFPEGNAIFQDDNAQI